MNSDFAGQINYLSGQINGLVILSSASLAITQYFYGNLRARFNKMRSRLEEMKEEVQRSLPENGKHPAEYERVRKQYDELLVVSGPSVGLQMMCLFVALCLSAVMMAGEIAVLCFQSGILHSCVMAGTLILVVLLIGIMIWTGVTLMLERIQVAHFVDESNHLLDKFRIIRNFGNS